MMLLEHAVRSEVKPQLLQNFLVLLQNKLGSQSTGVWGLGSRVRGVKYYQPTVRSPRSYHGHIKTTPDPTKDPLCDPGNSQSATRLHVPFI